MKESYEFDPSSIDASLEDDVTLDNWRPNGKVLRVPQSEWRKSQQKGTFNHEPGIDELKKINMYLKRKYPDHEIMEAFGITSETLVAVKRNCYSPVDGILLDNQSKIYREFTRIDKKLEKFLNALKFLADNVFDENDSAKKQSFKRMLGIRVKKVEEKPV